MSSNKIPWEDKTKQRGVWLSKIIWKKMLQEAAARDLWPVVVCEEAIAKYLKLDPTPEPLSFDDLEKSRHNLRLKNSLWIPVKVLAVEEERSASQVLEQILQLRYAQTGENKENIDYPDDQGQPRKN